MNENVSEQVAMYNVDLDTNIIQNENKSLRLINENLSKANQELSMQLTAERQRNSEIWKKIQSLDGNVGGLLQFKESFFNIKRHLDQKLKSCEDKSVQTWKNYICQSCVEFAQINEYFDEPAIFKEQFGVADFQRRKLCDIQEAIKTLKNALAEREDGIEELLDTYDASEHLIVDLKFDIKTLKDICAACKKHNIQLTDELKMKNKEISILKDKIQSLSKLVLDLYTQCRDSTLRSEEDASKVVLHDDVKAIIDY